MIQKSKKILSNNKKNEDKFLIYGKHAVIAALNNNKRKKFNLFISKKNHDLFKDYDHLIKIQYVEKDFFENNFKNANHQEVALEVSPLNDNNIDNIINSKIKTKSLIIILDQVTDPHNIGAIIRTAAAFNADAVINSFHNSPSETAIIAKTSCGGVDIVPYIRVTNIVNLMNTLKKHDYWCYGLDGNTDTPLPQNFPEKTCLILGSEDNGIRKLVRENCDSIFRINISKNMESLNVSVAASIAIHKIANL